MIKKVIFTALILLLCQLIIHQVYAVQAYPFPITVSQPDGTSLTIRLHGDEFHHYQTTEDGYLLRENAKGFLTYATMNAAGGVVESSVVARDITKRTLVEIRFLKSVNQSAIIQKVQKAPQKAQKSNVLKVPGVAKKVFPSTGSPKSLVILVNFADKSFITPNPQSEFTNLLNQENYSTNGGTGSARDYFRASTYGKFSPTFDVFGPVTLPQTLNYYGKNDVSGNDTLPVQMVVDACTMAHNAGLNFSQYDTDNDGVVDNVFIYYAGYNEAEGGPANTIWPHRWGVYPIALYSSTYNYSGSVESVTFDGKRVMDYACTSELWSSKGTNMCGVGTFCHEFGHVLGLPDYYDTSGKKTLTLNSWNIMDSGNYNNLGRTPPTYSVYDRFFLGYLSPEEERSPSNLTLNPIYQGKTLPLSTTNQAFLLSVYPHNLIGNNPLPNEFFMLEYRQKIGWDAYLPAEGMCIWHIDYDKTAWDNNDLNNYTGTSQTLASHMHVYLIPPSGVGTTPPLNAFTSGSFALRTWAGTDINRSLSDITKKIENVSFNFMTPNLSTIGSFAGFATTLGTPSSPQNINITTQNLSGNLILSLQNSINFDMKLPTDNSWSKSLSLLPTSGNVNATIQVRFNPTMTGLQTDQLKFSDTGLTTTNIDLSGTCTIGTHSPVIFVGKIDNTLQFSDTKLNDNNTKTINIQTTDLVGNLILGVTGNEASLFTISESNVTKDATNGSGGYTIIISFKPRMMGNHSATLTLSGGGLDPDKVIQLIGAGI